MLRNLGIMKMKYEVTFSREVTQQEVCKTCVEANSEEEAIELVENGDYNEVEVLDCYEIDSKDFTIDNIEKK
jgi:hypothetical protein